MRRSSNPFRDTHLLFRENHDRCHLLASVHSLNIILIILTRFYSTINLWQQLVHLLSLEARSNCSTTNPVPSQPICLPCSPLPLRRIPSKLWLCFGQIDLELWSLNWNPKRFSSIFKWPTQSQAVRLLNGSQLTCGLIVIPIHWAVRVSSTLGAAVSIAY
jgi:hypothetical protein